ncbi:MAG TPA: hypothetical protein VMS78_16355 [Rhizomicrobium sp.]|nr:hypothetical protein [Rhizomicrobium sp.]
MSELIQQNKTGGDLRRKFLTGVSALALAASVATPEAATAQDQDRSTVWIELGAQMSKLGESSEPYAPDFTSMRPSNFSPSQDFEKSARYSTEEFGKISLRPTGSDWVLSAAVRYGRSSVHKNVHEQSPFAAAQTYAPETFSAYRPVRAPRAARFAETMVGNSEQHLIADFQAGKDVGLGLFGKHGSSQVSLGVRFAQFTEKSNVALKSDPDWRFTHKSVFFYSSYYIHALPQVYHSNSATFRADRSFRGLGPSLSWNASEPISGNAEEGELNIDWGLNGAVLFGRQKSRIQRTETVRYNDGGDGYLLNAFYGRLPQGTMVTVYHHAPPAQIRSHSAVVPNVGGFAGLSFKYDTAKLTLGYRADFFFGAMDGGVDARKSYDRNFFGPYASISIGLGG